jgi:hypothetical protein
MTHKFFRKDVPMQSQYQHTFFAKRILCDTQNDTQHDTQLLACEKSYFVLFFPPFFTSCTYKTIHAIKLAVPIYTACSLKPYFLTLKSVIL